jgi:hypothetical protein
MAILLGDSPTKQHGCFVNKPLSPCANRNLILEMKKPPHPERQCVLSAKFYFTKTSHQIGGGQMGKLPDLNEKVRCLKEWRKFCYISTA